VGQSFPPHVLLSGPQISVSPRTSNMILENSRVDRLLNAIDVFPVFGYIIDGRLNPDRLKSALEQVIRHFPVLRARMCRNGKELMIPENQEDKELFSWTVKNHMMLMSTMFKALSTTDEISVSRFDISERLNFYIPLKSTVVRRPYIADECSPLIEVRVQLFIDKTVIGLSWNHILTDGGGISIILSSWAKALKGDSLPEVVSNKDPFKAFYSSNPAPPSGAVIPGFTEALQMGCTMITEIIRYGRPQARSIFIPNSVLAQWKSASDGVSTNDLITAWLLKAWASTVKSGTVSVITIMDLRKHLPEIVPPTYLRNASSARPSPHAMTVKDINKMSQLEVAEVIRSFVKHFSPEVELNFQSYEEQNGIMRMIPKSKWAIALSSWSRFNLPQIDFGAKTESFEGGNRRSREFGNVGCVWLEERGARITFLTSKRRWNMGVWKSLLKT
jgi:hypothetical protein